MNNQLHHSLGGPVVPKFLQKVQESARGVPDRQVRQKPPGN
jgi:hypothetical protein